MDYIYTISKMFPNVMVSCIGEPETYEHLLWEGGDALPSDADLITAWHSVQQDDMWDDIKTERDRRRAGGVFLSNVNKWFHSDDTSRIQQLGLVMFGANLPSTIMWKTMDSTFIQMTPSLAQQIFAAVATSDTVIFGIAEQKRSAMMQLDDPSSYDYLSGWPTIYGE